MQKGVGRKKEILLGDFMPKFAHIADAHLGAHREPILQDLELKAFKLSFEECLRRNVDFILLTGDLFNVGIPDLGIVNEGVKRLRETREKGIPVYAIYGSHDYTPTGTSIIDILESAGLIQRIDHGDYSTDGSLRLRFTVDANTGAKLTGLSARRMGLESRLFESLDRRALEEEKGFKIFAFHTAIEEFKPPDLAAMEAIPMKWLPKGFSYYAGGHLHDASLKNLEGYGPIAFPGALFPKDSRDLEKTVKGEKRGFFIVSFEKDVEKIEFFQVKVFDGSFYEYNASGKTPSEVQEELMEALKDMDVQGRIVLLKVAGELVQGKTSDVDFQAIRRFILERGALHLHLNRQSLTSKEYVATSLPGEDRASMEERLLKEGLSRVRISEEGLRGESGLRLAQELLKNLRMPPKPNEAKKDYEARLRKTAFEILNLKEVMEY
jgi:DNA repair exonuclease SbcCD nuclease subunit